jgi:2,5-diketo-D-gluconate reductase A
MTSEPPRVPTLNLHNGLHLPPVGLGTFKAQGEKLKIVVKCALQIGIRHIDTASIYRVS